MKFDHVRIFPSGGTPTQIEHLEMPLDDFINFLPWDRSKSSDLVRITDDKTKSLMIVTKLAVILRLLRRREGARILARTVFSSDMSLVEAVPLYLQADGHPSRFLGVRDAGPVVENLGRPSCLGLM